MHWTNSHKLIGAIGGSTHLPVVIGYHRVVERFPSDPRQSSPPMCITRTMLERHLDWIGRRFRFVSLDELGARMEWGTRFNERVAAVTFDDGYADVYENAYPLLQRKGIPAAVFVVTDLVGTSELQIHDLLYLLLWRTYCQWGSPPRVLARFLAKIGISLPAGARLDGLGRSPHSTVEVLLETLPQDELRRLIAALQPEAPVEPEVARAHRPLSWDELAEMHRAGITIGSHTRTHALLTVERPGKVMEEVAGSRQKLQARLNARVKHFAYPCGQFNAAAVQAVAQSGYRFAYTICRHRDDDFPLLTIPRRLLWERSCLDALGSFCPAILSCHVSGSFDVLAGCKLKHTPALAA